MALHHVLAGGARITNTIPVLMIEICWHLDQLLLLGRLLMLLHEPLVAQPRNDGGFDPDL